MLGKIGAPLLAAGRPDWALGLLQAPFPEQGLAQPQDAIAVMPVNMVEFFKSDMHLGDEARSGFRDTLYASKVQGCPLLRFLGKRKPPLSSPESDDFWPAAMRVVAGWS